MILFVNGLPLVVIELKNPADENATVKSAFKQIQTYKQAIPGLFTYNGLIIISDGLEAKAGTISAGFSRFMAWKTSDGKVKASNKLRPNEWRWTVSADYKDVRAERKYGNSWKEIYNSNPYKK